MSKTIISIILLGLLVRLLYGIIVTELGKGIFGLDGAAYLANINHFIGSTSFIDFQRPLLAPTLHLYPFVALLGDAYGLIIWAAVINILPVIALYYLATTFTKNRNKLIIITILANFEVIVFHLFWGGSVIALAHALIYTALYILRKRPKYGLLAIFIIMLIIPHSNIPSTGSAFFILAAFWLSDSNHSYKYAIISSIGALIGFITIQPYLGTTSWNSPIYYWGQLHLLWVHPNVAVWWLWLYFSAAAITIFFTSNKLTQKSPYSNLCIISLLVFATIFSWIAINNEPLYNITLRTSGALSPIAIMLLAVHWNTKLMAIITTIILICSVWFNTLAYEGGEYNMKKMLQNNIEDIDTATIYFTQRTYSFHAKYWFPNTAIYYRYQYGYTPYAYVDRINEYNCIMQYINNCSYPYNAWILSAEDDLAYDERVVRYNNFILSPQDNIEKIASFKAIKQYNLYRVINKHE